SDMPEAITSPTIEHYLEGLLPDRDPLLAEVEAHARHNRLPIVGPLEGQFLYVITRLVAPKRILELGACTGYSALWLAAATQSTSGRLTTIELDPERASITEQNFRRSPHRSRLTLIRGNALEVLPTLEQGAYDLVFNDLLRSGSGTTGGIPNQIRFLDLSLTLLKSGGVLVSDNVLCGGEVTGEQLQGTAASIAEYNRRLMVHAELETTIVPIRDGVAISIKR
ncbi:MAG TPA: O-methyltransferase, partial [Chloroflexota bacterium]|nr:O-methyltransferase [Chloroflexota bacterium]